MRAKEAMLDAEIPARKLGRIQSAVGDEHSRVVVFGQSIGADIRGRPLYVSWYNRRLEGLVLAGASIEDAANTLAGLGVTHVIYDNVRPQPEWKPWHEATERYGRLIARAGSGELYEFHADSVRGLDLLSGGPWSNWELPPDSAQAVTGTELLLPAAASASRAVDMPSVPNKARVSLSAVALCGRPSRVRGQINWLRADGSIIRSDAASFECEPSPRPIRVTSDKPPDGVTAYFYFTNDGDANVQLHDERASALPQL
jgi:hypothetical protein